MIPLYVYRKNGSEIVYIFQPEMDFDELKVFILSDGSTHYVSIPGTVVKLNIHTMYVTAEVKMRSTFNIFQCHPITVDQQERWLMKVYAKQRVV